MLLHPRMLRGLGTVLGRGAEAAAMPIFNTASLVGFGAVVTLLGLCRLTHRESDGDIFALAVAVPVAALVAVIALGSLFGSF